MYPIDETRLVFREDGRPLGATLDCPEPAAESPSIAIGFERSLDANFPKEMDAARAFLSRMRFTDDGAEASLWSFATTVDREADMTRDSAALRRALDGLSVASWPFNGTALYETMHRAIEDVNAAGSGTRKAVVFFTDGYNNTSLYGRSWDDVRGRAAVDNIRIYVVLVKNRDEGEQAMASLTAASGGFMVYENDPNAADSVYRALVEPDLARLWCTATVTSPMCANGRQRVLEAGYVRMEGDTLWSNVTYQAPRNPDDLQPLSVWCSPSAPLPGDTLQRLAIGVRLDDGWQPPAFTLALPLGGMRVETQEAGAWPADLRVQGDDAILDVSPPATGLSDGFHTLALLTLRGDPPREPWQPLLLEDASGCLRIETVPRPVTVAAALDTMRTERTGVARLTLRFRLPDLPEGAQRISAELSVDTLHARFDAARPFDAAALPAGWTLRSAALRLDGREEVLALEAAGPALDTPFVAGACLLRSTGHPDYLRPVRLRTAAVNLHAAAALGDGCIVIRDSCHNNLVALSGLAISEPWPQPAAEAVSLRFIAQEQQAVQITALDAAGRQALESQLWQLPAGASEQLLDVSNLRSGNYVLVCRTAAGVYSAPLVVVR